MKVYHYSRDKHHQYSGKSDARLDPMVPNRYVCPAFATFDKPPISNVTGDSIFFNIDEKKWCIKQIPKDNLRNKIKIHQVEKDYINAYSGLTMSDWTQLGDVNLTANSKKEWVEFRSKLRQIMFDRKPINNVFPQVESPIFPTKPKTFWENAN
jgi:hypothetical protein